jgi:Holliday junction resolvase RusA-like endonuclease
MIDTTTVHIRFHVAGVPAPQGSKTIARTADGRPYVRADNPITLIPWRTAVATAAIEAMADLPPLPGPLALDALFRFPRPKAHYRTGRNAGELKPTAPNLHHGRPDLDKLLRALGDALTGIVWTDDGQLARIQARKVYGSPGLHAIVWTLG